MKDVTLLLVLFSIALVGCATPETADETADVAEAAPALEQSPLEGAWEVVQASSGDLESDQVGLYIFHGDYYSILHIWNDGPRPLYEGEEQRNNVDHQKLLAIVDPVEGNSGKYLVDGATLTFTPLVAISPNFMGGLSRTYSFSISGDELTLNGGSIEGLAGSTEPNLTTILRRVD